MGPWGFSLPGGRGLWMWTCKSGRTETATGLRSRVRRSLFSEKNSKSPSSIAGLVILFILVSCQLRRVEGAVGGLDRRGNELTEEDDLQLSLIENEDKGHYYTHQWAAHIVGGKAVAENIARKHGFIIVGEIFPDYYHLVHQKVAKRSAEAHAEVHGRLAEQPEVRWAEQQKAKRRSKRDFLSPPSGRGNNGNGERGGKSRAARRSKTVNFNDPRWPQMWYLNRGPGLDMNVIEAWNDGITGKGIVVTILDDGLEKDHPDIIRNYDPMASFDVNSLDMDPMPTYDLTDSNRHGTRCAGEVAAEANNSICSVGIAFEAGVGGVRMLDGDVTDAVEARSLSHNPQHIDIYSASWGPDDDGKTVDGPGELATRAFLEGVVKGRNGKGSIFVWASGNGGRDHDNCNCDGYTNSIWTLSISSATENGLVPWYSEACSSTLATTYSSGGTGEKQIVTIDLHHSCTQSHTGTSASAPLAAGICALALQSNTNLTWRDMQHIVVRTARPHNLIASDWATNGVGRNVSHSFGYGLMDAGAMVKLARKWRNVPEQHKCEIKAPYTDKNIPAKSKVTLELKVTDCPHVRFLEHVQAKVTLTSGRRGDLQIYLVSPAGTRSCLLAHRRHDLNRSGFIDWPFMTVHNWGESPLGKWTLEIHNEGRYTDHKNGRTVLKRWSLVIYGIPYGTEDDVNSEDYKDKYPSNVKPASQEPNQQGKNSPPFPSVTATALNYSSTIQKLSSKTIITKTTSGNKEQERLETASGQVHVSTSGSSGEVVSISSNRKPSRQKQNKGKTLSKKQKVATSVPPLAVESHVIITSDDEEFKRLLKLKFNLNQNQTMSSSEGQKSLSENPENYTSGVNQGLITTSPPPSLSPSSSSSPSSPFTSSSSNLFSSPLKTEQNRSVEDDGVIKDSQPEEKVTEESTSVNQSQTIAGKLQTWSLIAHGIEQDPNGEVPEKPIGSVVAGTFDGRDNGVGTHIQEAPLPGNSDMVADSSLSVPQTSLTSSSSCAKMSTDGHCLECDKGLALYNGKCQSFCPEGFFGLSSSPKENPSQLLAYVCTPCHHSCRTCFGPGPFQCLSCQEDAVLSSSLGEQGESYNHYCYSVEFLDYIGNSQIWYKLLFLSLIVNIIGILVLICCICRRKCCGGSNSQVSPQNGQRYTRIFPEDSIPSGDEFENVDAESETEEFSRNDSNSAQYFIRESDSRNNNFQKNFKALNGVSSHSSISQLSPQGSDDTIMLIETGGNKVKS